MLYNDHGPRPNLWESRVDFNEIGYLPGVTLGPRRQSGLQILQIFQGHLHLEGESKTWDIGEGQAILLIPGATEMFYFSSSEPTTHGWATWDIEGDDLASDKVVSAYPECGKVINMDLNYLTLFRAGLVLARSGGNPCQINSLFIALLEEHLKERTRENLDARVQRAMNLIQRADMEDLSPEKLARGVHQSLPHLNRLFKENLGMTPSQAIWNQRLESASRLLEETGLTVEEVGQRTGMPNPSHFCKRFRQCYGVTPLQYRKRTWAPISV